MLAAVTLQIAGEGSAPVAADDSFTTSEDGVLNIGFSEGVLANDTDADGDPLTAELVAGPTNGTLALNDDGSFTYIPNADFSGSDSFTYTATDGAGREQCRDGEYHHRGRERHAGRRERRVLDR